MTASPGCSRADLVRDARQVERMCRDSSLLPGRLQLYLEVARISPGRLVLATDDRGHGVLFKERERWAGVPSLVVEHYFVVRLDGGAAEDDPVDLAEAGPLLDAVRGAYDHVWLALDNLPPNGGELDDEDHRYNLLPLAGLTYDAYRAGLSANARSTLARALRRTEGAAVETCTDPDEIARFVAGDARAHYHARYGDGSLLENALSRGETLLAVRIFPSLLLTVRLGGAYAFVVASRIGGALYVLFVGGSDPAVIRRAYHELVRLALDAAPALRVLDAASGFPALKRAMGFRQAGFHAVLKGECDWRRYDF